MPVKKHMLIQYVQQITLQPKSNWWEGTIFLSPPADEQTVDPKQAPNLIRTFLALIPGITCRCSNG
jgi:hypothetical protein